MVKFFLNRWISGVWLFLLVVCIVITVPVHADTGQSQVLIINSYHPGLLFSDNEISGVKYALRNESIDFFIEYMDSKRITTPEYRDLLFQIYKQKYSTSKFDAIVSLDDDAFRFLIKHGDTLFPGTPVIFAGVNNFDDRMIQGKSRFTGIVETISRNETIDLALQLHPGTKQVYVVTDLTTSGESNRHSIEETAMAGRFPVPLVFIDHDRKGMNLDDLESALKNAPPHTVVYYSDFFQDRERITYPPEVVMARISAVSNAPIYAHGDMYLGYGAVGGKMNSGTLQGEAAGEMVLRILHGEPVSSIDIQKEGPTSYMFDERQLKHWKIPVTSLPEGSRLLYHEESPLEKYTLVIVAVTLFVIAETWIIIVLLVNRGRRKRVEEELRQKEATLRSLINANPESVFLISVDGRILYTNETAANRFGLSAVEVTGRLIQDFLAPEIVERMQKSIEEVRQTGSQVRSLDTRECRIYDISYNPILDNKGKIIMIAILGIDITDSQQLQESLARINRKLKFLSDLTRTDLDNRMFVIRGYYQLLEKEVPGIEDNGNFEKLGGLFDSMAGSIEFSRQYQDLGAKVPLWQNVSMVFIYAISHLKMGTVTYENLPENLEVFADPLLEKVFGILVRKSLLPETGATKIRISCREYEDNLTIIYEDNGRGVAPGDKEKIFNPDINENREMFIVREILDVTRISIRETGIFEQGTRFEIRVPKETYRFTTGPFES